MDVTGLVNSLYQVSLNSSIHLSRFLPLEIGVPKVLRVAATVPDTEKKQYPLTEQTKMHISCVLSVVYHDLSSDKGREDFNNECIEFVK